MTGFGRLLDDLNRAGIRYVVVGGIAVIRHGVLRATNDLDVVIACDDDTAGRTRAAARSERASLSRRRATSRRGTRADLLARDLVALKRQTGRPTDLEDISRLETAHGTLPDPPADPSNPS